MNDIVNSVEDWNSRIDPAKEWNISATIGPIVFSIIVDAAFFTCENAQNSPKHKHAAYEFHFVTKGKGVIFTEEHPYDILPDSYFIVKAGIYHTQKASPAEPVDRYSFKFSFERNNNAYDSYSKEEIDRFISALSNIHCFCSKNLNKIQYILSEIQMELVNEETGYYPAVQHLFSLLLINIIREILTSDRQGPKIAQIKYQKDRMNLIDNFFDLNYDYKATSQQLCSLVNISKSQLNRILKEKYNMSFKKKHMEAQIEHIKEMLVNTDLSIGEIMERTGYTSENNFIAFFKNAVGISPKSYRMQSRQAEDTK